MPIIYRFILIHFYKYFILTIICSFFGAFITRISKLSNIFVFHASFMAFIKFFFHYMHLLAPFIIAFACAIANMATLKELFKSSLIKCIYAATVSYKKIITPLLINTFIWFLITLYSTCIVSPKIQLKLNEKLLAKTTFNPLIALKTNAIFPQSPFIVLGNVDKTNNAMHHFMLTLYQHPKSAPLFINATSSIYKKQILKFQNMHILNSDINKTNEYPTIKTAHFYKKINIPTKNISALLQKKTNTHLIKCLPFKYLLKNHTLISLQEIAYRLGFALFTLSLSLLVFTHFKNPTKNPKNLNLLFLTINIFICYFIAKNCSSSKLSCFLYLTPHILAIMQYIKPKHPSTS